MNNKIPESIDSAVGHKVQPLDLELLSTRWVLLLLNCKNFKLVNLFVTTTNVTKKSTQSWNVIITVSIKSNGIRYMGMTRRADQSIFYRQEVDNIDQSRVHEAIQF